MAEIEKITYIRDWQREVDKFADILKQPEDGEEQHSYQFVVWASEIQRKLNLKVYEP